MAQILGAFFGLFILATSGYAIFSLFRAVFRSIKVSLSRGNKVVVFSGRKPIEIAAGNMDEETATRVVDGLAEALRHGITPSPRLFADEDESDKAK